MEAVNFTAVAIDSEINLDKISEHFGSSRKYKWEEPLVLQEKQLAGVVDDPAGKRVYIFYFGAAVFINHTDREILSIVTLLKKIDQKLNPVVPLQYIEEYRLEIDPEQDPSISYDYMTTPAPKDRYLEILAIVLAKSAALERIEDDTAELLDEIESVIDLLEKGHFSLRDEKLAKMSAKILGFKYSTLSYIMLLDKPAITWDDEELERIFTELSEMFELAERFEKIRIKTETLLDITTVFTSLAHAKRDTRLEWIVIFLIFFEIVFSLLDKFVL